MIVEIHALEHNGTWDLVPLSLGQKVVGHRWAYANKVGPNGVIGHLKNRLVAKGYTQIYGLDYGDTFSSLPKMTIVCLFFVMTIMSLASPSITYPKCFPSW